MSAKKAAFLALVIFTTAATLLCALLWLQRLSLPYNEQGRYFDAANGVVYDQGAVLVYAILTFLLAFGAGLALRGAFRSR